MAGDSRRPAFFALPKFDRHSAESAHASTHFYEAADVVSTNNIAITAPPGLVSIVIPCCGMIDYTKLCVPSVLRHSRAPFELIFLDIGSLDGTAEYLAGLRDGLANRIRVEVFRAATDLNIPAAADDAIQAARGEYVSGKRTGRQLIAGGLHIMPPLPAVVTPASRCCCRFGPGC
jgi:hypothetical protein